MFDFIGDVHGCIEELLSLLIRLEYTTRTLSGGFAGPGDQAGAHPNGRKIVFVGDLNDRGPDSVAVLKLAMEMCKSGRALCVTGNHDDKLRRALQGNKIKPKHGLQETLNQLSKETEETRNEIRSFLQSLPYRMLLDEGKVLVCHAGLPEWMHLAKENGHTRSHCLYGDVDGTTDGAGLPIRKDWTKDYQGSRIVVHGHVPVKEPDIRNNVYNIDTCCYGGNYLTALRYPEMEIVQVKALREYAPWARRA